VSRKKRRGQESSPYYWQTEEYNQLCLQVNIDMLLAIAVNRFRWEGLPSTCDPRYLEIQLHRSGIATICHDADTPDVWQTLMAAPQGEWNDYGIPTEWRARGYNDTDYKVTPATGELVYYSQTRLNPWGAIMQYAVKLTHIQRTSDVNLMHQQHPWVMLMPREKQMELINIFKQISGYEPAILGDSANKALLELNEGNCFTLDLKVPFLGKELTEQYQNVLNQYLLFMGVPHIMFEKSERMITEEATAGNSTTNILLKNCLDARRWACKQLRELAPSVFGDLQVYLNDDWESYNYNYLNNRALLDENNAQADQPSGGGNDDGSK
jgi:hypothetical protein